MLMICHHYPYTPGIARCALCVRLSHLTWPFQLAPTPRLTILIIHTVSSSSTQFGLYNSGSPLASTYQRPTTTLACQTWPKLCARIVVPPGRVCHHSWRSSSYAQLEVSAAATVCRVLLLYYYVAQRRTSLELVDDLSLPKLCSGAARGYPPRS